MINKNSLKCVACGAGVRRFSEHGLCASCKKKADAASPHVGPGRGHRVRLSDETMQCKMPKCRKSFTLRPDQDRRYTIYCPECRGQIAEITPGILYLERMGIEVLMDEGEEILMDSLAKAYEPNY